MNEQLERRLAGLILQLPQAARRRIAGPPVQREGLTLELNTQVLLKLAEREPRPPLSSLTPAETRAGLGRSVSQDLGPPIPLPEVREVTVAGAEGTLRARFYVPPADPGDERP